MIRVSQDKNIIQIYNYMTTLARAKEKYGFSKRDENPRGCSQPKRQNLPLIRFVVPNKCTKQW